MNHYDPPNQYSTPSSRTSRQIRPQRFLISIGVAALATIVTWAIALAATSVSGNFPQCADRNLNGSQCDWTNGNITGSYYVEGTGVPQSNQLGSLHAATGSTDVYSYTWSTTFSSNSVHHGYDFIMSYDQAKKVHQDYQGVDLDIDPCTANADQNPDHICQKLRAIGPYVGNTVYSYTISVPDDPFISGSFVKDGSVQNRINTFESKYGDRKITLWTDQPITGSAYLVLTHTLNDAGFTPIGNGGDAIAGSTLVRYTLYFTSSTANAMIEYAAHFALSGNPYVDPLAWGWDATNGGYGAGGLTGSNWHVKDFKLNGGALGTLGSQDNQAGTSTPTTYPISSDATWNSTTKHATDAITMTTSSNTAMTGTVQYWVCADTTVPYTDTLTNGCTSTTTATFVGNALVNYASKQSKATSPIFTPTVSGRYCFLTLFFPRATPPNLAWDFGATADTNSTTECFMAFGPNAVTLKAITAQVVAGDLVPLSIVILMGVAAVLLIAWAKRHRLA